MIATSRAEVGDPYQDAVDDARRHGLRVWLESDLVKRWEGGQASFFQAVRRIGVLAARPGVVGVRIADELGYRDGMDSPKRIREFLTAARNALDRVASGKKLLVGLYVPELGCLSGCTSRPPLATVAAARLRGQYPHLSLDNVERYLRLRAVDVVDLSTGLQSTSTYASWGVDRDTAQRQAWASIRARGWDDLVTLHARTALAHPGRYPGGRASAEADVRTFIDVPLSAGAVAVDVWTWRQRYQGGVSRLADPGPRPNALWAVLRSRHEAGVRMFTHFSPYSVERDRNVDLAMISTVFTDLFLAAGTA